jgi:subfamily B ATP-binding cassette protein MsbA
VKIKFLKRLFPYIKAHLKLAIGAFLLSFVLAGLKVYQAYLVKPIFDKGLSEKATFEEVLLLGGILLAVMLINFPSRFLHFYWLRFIVDKATCAVRSQMFEKLQRLPISYFQKNKGGNLVSHLVVDTQIFSQGFRAIIDAWREPITGIGFLALAFYRDWALTLIIIAVVPLFLIIFQKSGKHVKNHQAKVQDEQGEMTHVITEGVQGQKITKAFNLQAYVKSRFEKIQNRFFESQMKTTWVEEFAHPLVELVGGIAFSGIIVFAHYRIKSGAMTTGDFVSFVTALALFMDPIRKLSQANIKLSQAQAAGARIFSLLDLPEEPDKGKKEVKFEKEIKVENLSFSYGDGEVLKDFSMTIKKGEKVALVGLSGSGKSTLMNLFLGLYPFKYGAITIDGTPLQDFSLQSLRDMFGLVSQDLFLFNDSVKENLMVGKNVNASDVAKALKVAYADEFIKKLPENIETIIGDRGTRLSGGQAQRITIARAFLQKSSVLLFDEATSALDNESEKVVQKALDELSKDHTVIAVAHRLSTIQDFDRIYLLKDGRLVESGTHTSLISAQGEYSKLYELSQYS